MLGTETKLHVITNSVANGNIFNYHKSHFLQKVLTRELRIRLWQMGDY